MLFLAERPAIPGRGRAPETAERPGEAESLIKEARRRRRRRWIRGAGAVLLVAAGATTWIRLEHPTVPRTASVTASRPATAGTCASAVTYGPLPTWARAGFRPPTVTMPYVLGDHGDIVAVLWARHDPLATPTPPGRANKILWVSKLLQSGSSLQITAQRLAGGTIVGPIERRTVAGGPGPSTIDMPTAGCWQFTLRWGGHTDTVNLPYAAG